MKIQKNAVLLALACVVSSCFVAGCSNQDEQVNVVSTEQSQEMVKIGLTNIVYESIDIIKDRKFFCQYYVQTNSSVETTFVDVPKVDTLGVITRNRYGFVYSEIVVKSDSTYRLQYGKAGM